MWKRNKTPSLTVIETRIIQYQPCSLSVNHEGNGTKSLESETLNYCFTKASDYRKSKSLFSVARVVYRRNTGRFLVGCFKGRRSLGRPKSRLKKKFKIYLKEIS